MPKSHDRLQALADKLERDGSDPLRLEVVRRAERFKRSWIELASALADAREQRAFERWGYADLHEYCQKELALRPATVDKLLLSYGTVRTHAPQMLKAQHHEVPSLESVDYFARAIAATERPSRRLDAPEPAVLDQLRTAVFDQGRSLPELRGEFGPLLHPKAELSAREEARKRARAAAQRVLELLPELRGVSEARVGRVTAALEALINDLDALDAARAKPAARTASKKVRA